MKMKNLKRVFIWGVSLVAIGIVLFLFVYRPWALNWGAAGEEINRKMPGDEIVQHPTFNATRAVTIEARPEDIWPWIIQIGYKKAGFYSYDRLDNDGIPSAEHIIPEYQNLAIGDSIRLDKNSYINLSVLEANRFMVLVFHDDVFTWAWGLYIEDENHTRLITRLRWYTDNLSYRILLDTFEIVMMRKHMLGIKRRAEAMVGLQ